jgi:thiol-disulfide isomerase/thioredoxin
LTLLPFLSMKVIPLALLGAGLLAGCHSGTTETGTVSVAALLKPGPWRGELAIQGQQLPFLFEVKEEGAKPVVYLINKGLNGEERLRCDEISAAGDSITIRLHAFDAALVVRYNSGQSNMSGVWVKYDTKTPYRVPLTIERLPTDAKLSNPYYGNQQENSDKLFTGTWRTTFTDEDGKSYPAVGIFSQDPQKLTGTFLTTTGDYRYLGGRTAATVGTGTKGDEEPANTFRLTTFDGGHAFLFTAAKQPDGTLKGDFYSGKSGHETWTATLDPKAKLPDADTLTYLKKGESRLNFKFPSVVKGGSISPTDPKYRGKVVVIQVLGSWCPNCMDETKFLAPWYEQNKARGVEVIGLGYERMPEYDQAAARLRQMKERLHVGYDLAAAGVSNKDSVAKSMPQLAKFLAFPTTIFLDKKGVVRSIHTGFSGPGTGKYYAEETAGFNRTVDKLLNE